MTTEALNTNLRPLTIYMLVGIAGLFLLALMTIMLVRYAVHGEIDWQGLVAFLGFIATFIFQHFQNRHDIQCRQIDRGVPPFGGPAINPHGGPGAP